MIGQENLKQRFLTLYNSNKLSKVNIINAPKGYGKKEFIKWLSQEVNIPYKLFTKKETSSAIDIESLREAISEANNDFSKIFYVFENIEDNKNKNIQNCLLKFFEEPPNNIYIFLLVSDKNLLLPTILNRGVQYNFESYSKEELKYFNDNELALELFNNPQELIKAKEIDVNQLITDTTKIVQKLDAASLGNALKLNSYIKLNDKDEGLYDIDLFVKALKYSFYIIYKDTKDQSIKEKFNILQEAIYQLKVNGKYFMDTFIITNYLRKVK